MNIQDIKAALIGQASSWRTSYIPGRVVKTTAHFIDVQIGEGQATRFNMKGRRAGSQNPYRDNFLDTVPFEERFAELAKKGRQNNAIRAINNVAVPTQIGLSWSKESLQEVVAQLAAKLEDARKLVEEI